MTSRQMRWERCYFWSSPNTKGVPGLRLSMKSRIPLPAKKSRARSGLVWEQVRLTKFSQVHAIEKGRRVWGHLGVFSYFHNFPARFTRQAFGATLRQSIWWVVQVALGLGAFDLSALSQQHLDTTVAVPYEKGGTSEFGLYLVFTCRWKFIWKLD